MIVRENIGGGDLRGFGPLRTEHGRGGYGSLGCSQLTAALAVLQQALNNADAAGVSSTDNNYALAQAWMTQQNGFFSSNWSDFTDCQTVVSQTTTLIAGVNQSIATAGGTQVSTASIPAVTPGLLSGGGIDSLIPGAGGWLTGLLVVVGVLGGGWILYSVSKIYTTAKKAKAVLPSGA